MNCAEAGPLLDEYDSGELAPGESAAVADHLRGCKSCERALERLVGLGERARALPSRAVAPGFVGRLHERLGLLRPGFDRRHTEPLAWHPADTSADEARPESPVLRIAA